MTDHLRNRFANVAERLTHSFTELTSESGPQVPDGSNDYFLNERYQQSTTDQSKLEELKIDNRPVMTFRDRSSEFSSAVKSLQSRQMLNGTTRGNGPGRTIQERTHFTKLAKKVGKDLASTCVKLEKLTMLAKRKTLFDDKPLEIQELTYIIKQDLNSLNQQIAQLGEINRSRSSATSTNNHIQSHATTVVAALQTRLANLSTDFKSALDIRTENLKASKTRKDNFSQSTPSSNSSGSGGIGDRSVLFRDEQLAIQQRNSPSSSAINIPAESESDLSSLGSSAGPSGAMLRSRHVQQMALMEETDTYVNERAAAMENIESTVVELGHIFSQLATMVKEQDEMIGRIDHNVEDSLMNVNAAHTEILKYFQSVSSNRWLMIKVFGVLIVFFIIFVLFFA